jgi:hypothetical protein
MVLPLPCGFSKIEQALPADGEVVSKMKEVDPRLRTAQKRNPRMKKLQSKMSECPASCHLPD